MKIDSELLKILCCPKCKNDLELKEGSNPGFICRKCQLHYAIVDGIPNFLVHEAKPLKED